MSRIQKHSITVSVVCLGCGKEFLVKVSPYIPARIHGPPENCYPAEDGEVDPEECPACDEPVDSDDAREKAAKIWEEREQDRADYLYERMREEGR